MATAPDTVTIDRLLEDGARVMWIAAHPDDEVLVGPILAKAGPALGNPLYFLVLTHGEGGECCIPDGCHPDLATVRAREMQRVAERYGAELQHERFYNASLPVESFPLRHEIARLWREHKDPASVCAEAIRRFRPNVLLTFDPNHGFTGHPEHQIASRFATAGAHLAADESREPSGPDPHRVEHVFYGLNRYFPLTLLGRCDPGPVTHRWSTTRPCLPPLNCRDVMVELSREHRSQERDMSTVRRLKFLLRHVFLRRVDPFEEIKDPYEPA